MIAQCYIATRSSSELGNVNVSILNRKGVFWFGGFFVLLSVSDFGNVLAVRLSVKKDIFFITLFLVAW